MGTTFLGIDLDESPFGGLIKSLLDDEDLEKLDEAEVRRNALQGEESSTADTGSSTAGASPGDAGDEGGRLSGLLPSVGGGDTATRLSRVKKWLFVLTGIGLVLAVVGVVARYLLRRRNSGDSGGTAGGTAGSEASGRSESATDVPVGGETADDSTDGPTDEQRAERPSDEELQELATVGSGDRSPVGGAESESDAGALFALGVLALIAAVVRKLGEPEERDPLVDGPDEY